MDKLEMMRVFCVVARTASFTKAAVELNIATQTVSKYVKALEDRLGAQLFDRTTRKVMLNHTGNAYYERCVDLLEQFDEVESSVSTLHGTPKGTIRISAPTAFGERHLVDALRDFQLVNPDIMIELDLSNRRVSVVEEGYDMVLRISELSDSSLIAKKLCSMPLVVCASPEYLDKYGSPTVPDDLAAHNCYQFINAQYGKYWPFNINGDDIKVEVSGRFKSNSPSALSKMAVAGLGIALSPLYIVSDDIRAGRLVTLFEQYQAYSFGVYAIYPHRKHLSKRVRVLVDFLAARFARLY